MRLWLKEATGSERMVADLSASTPVVFGTPHLVQEPVRLRHGVPFRGEPAAKGKGVTRLQAHMGSTCVRLAA